MRIDFIAFKSFPPFADATIEFPEQTEKSLAEVQLITGQNGSGKTRLLCALAAACGNASDLQARHPTGFSEHEILVGLSRDNRNAVYIRSTGSLWLMKNANDQRKLLENMPSRNLQNPFAIMDVGGKVKEVVYADQIGPSLVQWKLKSNVAVQAYRGTGRISDRKIAAMQPVKFGEPSLHISFERPQDDDALICQSMVNLKLGAAMESLSGAPTDECRSIKIIARLESAIGSVTGRKFSFQVKPNPDMHLEVRWGTAIMNLAVLPDGLRSIIAWLVACIAKLDSQFPDHPNPLDIPLILLIDEPESHLHPAWQRQVIPAAQRLFPSAQIFVATHSPFVISSVNSGWIHVLRIDDEGVVTANTPIPCSKGDSYIDVVDAILGLSEWYDPETELLLKDFRSLRNEVVRGKASLQELEAKGALIGSRSDSLEGMMAREISQVRRKLSPDVVQK